MKCCSCNEDLIGDGYTSALHCPNISEDQQQSLDYREPDADPLYCDLENFELEPWRFVVLDIAYEYGLTVEIAESVVATLNLKSLAELDARYLGHYSVYNNIEELEHDIYEVHGRNIPYRIVHNLIVADKPYATNN